MPPPTGVWGIDIGQCALKALRLELVDGKPTATAFDYVEHPKILSQPDADPDVLIREALEKFLSRNQIGYDEVAVGIAGQSGLARFVKLPPVEEKKIAEIVKFEARQQIPFPLDEVVWDFQKVAGGPVTDGFAMETEIGLFAMKRDVISRYLGYFAGSKIEVHQVQMAPLALVNYTTYDVLRKGGTVPAPPADDPGAADTPRGKKRCAVVLDIGTEASNLVITDGEKIIWQRPIPLGGNNFTRALTKELKLTFAKAEHLKRNAAKSPELPQILKALKPVLQDFVGEVQRSLGYFTNTHRDAHVGYLVGVGSAFRLPGLQKYLAEKLQLDVRKPAGFARMDGDAVKNDPLFVENLLSFPVAYGLALQGLGEARLTTNLLPPEIRTDRLVRAKKPYAVAAAAALLLGTAGLALGYGASYAAVTDPTLAKGVETAKGAIDAANKQETKFSAKKGEIDKFSGQVKTIIAGQDERLNWPRFNEVFSAALPKPGPDGNLETSLWRGADGRGAEAVKWFYERMRVGVPADKAIADDQSNHPLYLAMVNIEAVYPRWVDSLPNFFQNADDQVSSPQPRGWSQDIARWMKPDEKEPDAEKNNRPKPKIPAEWTGEQAGGWVVEVRGYTEHAEGEPFIAAALIKNLQRMDQFVDAVGGPGKVAKYVPGVADPVKGKCSHAFIYHVWSDTNPSPTGFKHINRSYLDPLAGGTGRGGAAGGAGGGLAGMMQGQMGAMGDKGGPMGSDPGMMSGMMSGGGGAVANPAGQPWTPLSGGGAAAGGPAGGPAGGLGAPAGVSGGGGGGLGAPDMEGGYGASQPGYGPPAPGGGGMEGMYGAGAGAEMMGRMKGLGAPTPGAPVPPGAGGGSPGVLPPLAEVEIKPRRRWEFVVMFVWREPVPIVTPPELQNPGG
jgi:type IV pilus assembly protein PilM